MDFDIIDNLTDKDVESLYYDIAINDNVQIADCWGSAVCKGIEGYRYLALYYSYSCDDAVSNGTLSMEACKEKIASTLCPGGWKSANSNYLTFGVCVLKYFQYPCTNGSWDEQCRARFSGESCRFGLQTFVYGYGGYHGGSSCSIVCQASCK